MFETIIFGFLWVRYWILWILYMPEQKNMANGKSINYLFE